MDHRFEGPPRGPAPARHRGGRVSAYFLVLILLNVLLGVFLLYMLGISLAYDWTTLKTGSLQAILEAALQLLLLFSPVILTILLNRVLFRVFRGYGRFPRGIWFFAILTILAVQAATVLLIIGYGFVDGVDGFNIESISQLTGG
jgi:hypothetical protein